jgi:hypothetical protein
LIAHTRGTMPVALSCRSEEEAALARRLLVMRQGRGAELINIFVTEPDW